MATHIHHGLHADGEGHFGHFLQIMAEEAGVGEDGLVGQGLDARAAAQAGAGLVEGDVPIGPDAAEEELDPPRAPDLLLVRDALLLEVGGVAVEDVDVRRVDVDVAEEVLVHERVVRLRVFARDADVFVLFRTP